MDDEPLSAWQRAHDQSIAEADQESSRRSGWLLHSDAYLREVIVILALVGGSIAMIVRGDLLLVAMGVVTLAATVLGVLGLLLNRR